MQQCTKRTVGVFRFSSKSAAMTTQCRCLFGFRIRCVLLSKHPSLETIPLADFRLYDFAILSDSYNAAAKRYNLRLPGTTKINVEGTGSKTVARRVNPSQSTDSASCVIAARAGGCGVNLKNVPLLSQPFECVTYLEVRL